MEATPTMTMERFSGIDNVTPATRLISNRLPNGCPVWPLQQAVNVDIDDAYRIKSRAGYDELFAGTGIHSLWADGPEAFFVDQAILNRLVSVDPFQRIQLGSVKTDAPCSFFRVNDRVYWTNGTGIGYVVANTMHALTDPGDLEFKLPIPAGQLIAHFRAKLYVARDNVLFETDPLTDFIDVRRAYRQFARSITMLCPVDDGLYVSDAERVWWLRGESLEEFDRREVYPYPAIIRTALVTNGQHLDRKGNVAIWTGTNGICIGDNSGTVVNLTESVYDLAREYTGGAAVIRESGSIKHYLNSLF